MKDDKQETNNTIAENEFSCLVEVHGHCDAHSFVASLIGSIPHSNNTQQLPWFHITHVYALQREDCLEPHALSVTYVINEVSGTSQFPLSDLKRRNLAPHFPRLIPFTMGVKKGNINNMIIMALLSTQHFGRITIPKKSGWRQVYTAEGYKLEYSHIEQFLQYSIDPLPEGLCLRHLPCSVTCDKIMLNRIITEIFRSVKSKIVLAFRWISFLLYFGEPYGFRICKTLVLEPPANIPNGYLVSLLKTHGELNPTTRSLLSTKTKTEKWLALVNDGVVLFDDVGYAEDAAKRTPALLSIREKLHSATGDEHPARNVVAIISNHIGKEIPSEEMWCLNFDGEDVTDCKQNLQLCMFELDRGLIKYIINHHEEVCMIFKDLGNQRSYCQSLLGSTVNGDAYAMFIAAGRLYERVVGAKYWSSEDINFLKRWLTEEREYADINQAIMDDFFKCLNQFLADEKVKLIPKDENGVFIRGGDFALIHEGLISFEPIIFKRIINDLMVTTKNTYRVVDSLLENKALYCTKKKRHHIYADNAEGKKESFDVYSIRQQFLDMETIMKISQLPFEEFYLERHEIDDKGFLPLLRVYDGRLAGIRYNRYEDGHIFITGQSGYGKTTMLARIAATRAFMGHRVVIFDSSGAFTDEEIKKMFPDRIIQNKLTVYDVKLKGCPVNLFDLNGYTTKSTKKQMIADMLCAATDDLDKSQVRKLKTAISPLLDRSDKITLQDIIQALKTPPDPDHPQNYNPTYECILARLDSLFEDLNEYGMKPEGWEAFFETAGPITIIRFENTMSAKDNPLVDMLIASLYNYQAANHKVPLAIICDEIQDQNFSPVSPNYQMLAKTRKLGISFIGATLHYRTKGVAYGEAMALADIRIFLKPTPNSIRLVAQEVGLDSDEGVARLKKMRIGDCIISCNFYSKKDKMNIPAILNGNVPAEEDLPATDGSHYCGNVRP